MKLLIIGSEGFIGSGCAAYFSTRKYGVYRCDIIPGSKENYFPISAENPDFDTVFSNILPDVCINASGSADVGFSIRNPDIDLKLNVQNVERILLAIKRVCPDCKLLNFSSAAVYGNPVSLPVSEAAPINPLSPYGRHKLKSELLLKEYHDIYGLHTCSMRVFSAYGVGLKKQLFWDIYQKTLLGRNVSLFGTGDESRDFIFIDDLIRAIDQIIQKGSFSGDAINVSSGVETTVKEAATKLLSFLGKDLSLVFSGEEKAGDPKNWRADISKLKKLGFIPFVTFDAGIKKYAEWLKESE